MPSAGLSNSKKYPLQRVDVTPPPSDSCQTAYVLLEALPCRVEIGFEPNRCKFIRCRFNGRLGGFSRLHVSVSKEFILPVHHNFPHFSLSAATFMPSRSIPQLVLKYLLHLATDRRKLFTSILTWRAMESLTSFAYNASQNSG